MRQLPSTEYLRRRFLYNPTTGVLTWRHLDATTPKNKQFNSAHAGKKAGCPRRGYVFLRMDGHEWGAHRIIWKLVTGRDPVLVDHKNCDGTDNRIVNLREASWRQNAWNSRLSSNNTSGYKGVSHRCNAKVPKFRAYIRVNGVQTCLGQYPTAEEAAAVYAARAARLCGDFLRLK